MIGPFTIERTFFILFDNSKSRFKCPYDNALVYDENKNLIFDFCKKYSEQFISYVRHNGRYLFIEFKYGSNEFFSLGFEWWAVDLIKENTPQTTKPTSTSTTTTIATTITQSTCGIPAVQMIAPFIRIIGGFNVVPNRYHQFLIDY